MNKIKSIVGLLLLFLAFSLTADDRPNVVVFLTDDQGWGDLSVNGNKNLSTPNIDSLATDGAILDNFYVCAVCAPNYIVNIEKIVGGVAEGFYKAAGNKRIYKITDPSIANSRVLFEQKDYSRTL